MNIDQAQELYQRSIKPCLFMLEPEFAHSLAHNSLAFLDFVIGSGLIQTPYNSERLTQNFFSSRVFNPVGLASGFDKNGTLCGHVECLGFGFIEIGSVTAKASSGNPRPRLFRLPDDQALINYMGLNGDGADVVVERLKHKSPAIPFGINIAKTNDPSVTGDRAIEDLIYSFKAVKKVSTNYIAINLSCPNTHAGIADSGRELRVLLEEIGKENGSKTPIMLKLSPDSDDRLLEEIFTQSAGYPVAGFICGNTSTTRNQLQTASDLLSNIKAGGLSGKPLKSLALSLVRKVFERKKKDQLIIACGGISNGMDAFEMISSGASFLQLYTAMVYQGPFVAYKIAEDLDSILLREKMTIKEAIGSTVKVRVK